MRIESNIGDEGARALSEALHYNKSLTKLSLLCNEKKNKKKYEDNKRRMRTANHIGDEGAAMISKALNSNCSLTDLSLDCDEKTIINYESNSHEKTMMMRFYSSHLNMVKM